MEIPLLLLSNAAEDRSLVYNPYFLQRLAQCLWNRRGPEPSLDDRLKAFAERVKRVGVMPFCLFDSVQVPDIVRLGQPPVLPHEVDADGASGAGFAFGRDTLDFVVVSETVFDLFRGEFGVETHEDEL